jgi:AcrR family transcriptional regulator
VLVKHGYAGLTLERIAEEAGLNRVTLHRRGLSKDQIFNALVAQTVQGYRDAFWPALAADGTGAERLQIGLDAMLEDTERNVDVLLAVRAQVDTLYHQDEDAERPAYTVVDPIELLVRDGVADGSLRESDPKETALLLSNWVGWTYLHLRTAHRLEPKQARSLVLRRVMQALMP